MLSPPVQDWDITDPVAYFSMWTSWEFQRSCDVLFMCTSLEYKRSRDVLPTSTNLVFHRTSDILSVCTSWELEDPVFFMCTSLEYKRTCDTSSMCIVRSTKEPVIQVWIFTESVTYFHVHKFGISKNLWTYCLCHRETPHVPVWSSTELVIYSPHAQVWSFKEPVTYSPHVQIWITPDTVTYSPRVPFPNVPVAWFPLVGRVHPPSSTIWNQCSRKERATNGKNIQTDPREDGKTDPLKAGRNGSNM